MLKIIYLMFLVMMFPTAAFADSSAINQGDTAWMLISTALVMLMTPGLGLFYGGMVRSKNVLGTILHSFIMLCMVSVIWVIWGYSFAFGNDVHGFIGGFTWFGMNGVGLEPSTFAASIPHLIFMMYQGMFAAITPALITGAFAERMKFSALLVFSAIWITLVYAPVCHWVWGGGWISQHLAALDFAGGMVVHINSAIAALAAIIVIGKRRGFGSEPMMPHNLPMTIMGAALLWFGWFGFNAGSALTSGGLAALAFVTTNTASSAAALGWLIVEWRHRGKPTALGAVSGAVAGLVAITPAAGFVSPMSALIIGFIAGGICYMAVSLKSRTGLDDSLDVLGIHGVGGTWGAIATGLFATKLLNPSGQDGLFYGNSGLIVNQLLSILAVCVYVFIVSFIILKVIDKTIGLRITEEQEYTGLDLALHGENGYELGVSGHGGSHIFRKEG